MCNSRVWYIIKSLRLLKRIVYVLLQSRNSMKKTNIFQKLFS